VPTPLSIVTELPKEFAPLPPFIVIDLTVVDESQDSKVRDPPAPKLDDPAPPTPTPDKDHEPAPAVNSIEPPPSAPDELCTKNEASLLTFGTVMHLHLLEPSNCHRFDGTAARM
jgi:hypothetical protein